MFINDYFLRKNRNKETLDYLEVHVTDHCNLNCACCCHFAPLAEKYFMSTTSFKKDIVRLAYLSGGNIRRIRLMGGEPLLHPEITEFIKIARENFPFSEIAIHSNGILLGQMRNVFWETCAEYQIDVILSYYPVDINYTLICNKAKEYSVVLKIDIDTSKKMFRNFKMDLTGTQSYRESWRHCTHANSSVNLYEGRLYTCDIVAHSKHLAKYFNIPLEYTDKDFIDIYKEESMEAILKKLNKPHPFCRYCRPTESHIVDWQITNKKLEEWAEV